MARLFLDRPCIATWKVPETKDTLFVYKLSAQKTFRDIIFHNTKDERLSKGKAGGYVLLYCMTDVNKKYITRSVQDLVYTGNRKLSVNIPFL